MKPFDDSFSRRVNEVFGSYNADHLASHGWQALEASRPKSKRVAPVIPFWAKAATIAILLTIGSVYVHRVAIQIFYPSNDSALQVPKITAPASEGAITMDMGLDKQSVAYTPAPGETEESIVAATPFATPPPIGPIVLEKNTAEEYPSTPAPRDASTPDKKESDDSQTLASTAELDKSTLLPNINLDPELSEVNTSKAVDQVLPERQEPKASFGLGVASMLAWVDSEHSSEPGVSVGMYADYRVTSSISIRPGLAIARHSFGLSEPITSNEMMFSPERSATLDEGLKMGYLTQEAHIEMVVMEVPLALSFKLSEGSRGRLYASAGVSTLIYLQQRFTNTYHVTNPAFLTPGNEQSLDGSPSFDEEYGNSFPRSYKQSDEYGAFQHSDLFGLANLSVGYAFRVGGSTLYLEPFVQLPLSGVTSSSLNMIYGGVSVRYRIWGN